MKGYFSRSRLRIESWLSIYSSRLHPLANVEETHQKKSSLRLQACDMHVHKDVISIGAAPGGGGGTDLERGFGDVRPWRLPFHASPVVHKGPISSKTVSSQDPLLRKFWNFSLYSLNFCPNLSSQAPKFGNFQLTSPQIWKISAHKPPISEAKISSLAQAPLRKSGPHTPTWKKSWVPPWSYRWVMFQTP